jgi:hypothetical protein
MKNIHLIPTNKPSRLRIGNNGNFVFGMMQTYIQSRNDFYTNQHIYITSEKEDFNENDYVITKDGRLVQVSYLLSKDLDGAFKVVIASDPDLIADGVQAIDDEFLEWFVKNPSCESVEVKKGFADGTAWGYNFLDYKIIIPEEEPKQEIIASEEDAKIFVDTIENPPAPNEKLKTAFEKQLNQETLEEAAGRLYPDGCDGTNRSAEIYRRIFIDGAKLQAERMYSEEEVIEHLNHLIMMPSSKLDKFTNDEEMVTMKWFEQFKENKL